MELRSLRLWDTGTRWDQIETAPISTPGTPWARQSTTPAPAAPPTPLRAGVNPAIGGPGSQIRSVRAGTASFAQDTEDNYAVAAGRTMPTVVPDSAASVTYMGHALSGRGHARRPPVAVPHSARLAHRSRPAGCQNTDGAALLLRGRGWQGFTVMGGQGGTATVDASRLDVWRLDGSCAARPRTWPLTRRRFCWGGVRQGQTG